MVETNLGELLWQGFCDKVLKDNSPKNMDDYIRAKFMFLTGVISGMSMPDMLDEKEEGKSDTEIEARSILGKLEIAVAYHRIQEEFKKIQKKS